MRNDECRNEFIIHHSEFIIQFMPVIKSINAPTNLSPFSMKDIEAQARAILLRAQQRAEQLLTEAQISADELKQKALAEGIIEGRREGVAKGTEEGKKLGQQQALAEHKAQLTQVINAMMTGSKELNASRKQLESKATAEVVKLAISIARRVTKKYGELDPNVLTANVSEAMKLVVRSTDIRIAIHPAQRSTLTNVLPQLKLQWPALEHVNLVDDATVKPGGCVIRAGQGEVNADLDAQIDRIASELLPDFLAPPLAAGAPEVPNTSTPSQATGPKGHGANP
jgi:flagellar assembly protein FliH